MSITSKTIQGVGDSGCLEYAAYMVVGEGNSRTHKFSFRAQQPIEVEANEEDEGLVHITITGDNELHDIVAFITGAIKA